MASWASFNGEAFDWWRALQRNPPAMPSPAEENQKLQRVEAILFVSRDPLPSRKLSQLANLADGTEARTLVRRLNQQYDEVGRAFRVEEVAGGYLFMTRRKLASWVRRLHHAPAEVRLSAPALETLAVIAYRQPVLRADIEGVRGVNCGEILRQLLDRELIRISGRSEELGRPYLYSTTKRFLQLMGLKSIDLLPRIEQLRVCAPDDTRFHENASSDDRLNEDSDMSVSTLTAPQTAPHSQDGPLDDEQTEQTLVEPKQALEDDEFEDEYEDDGDEYDDDLDDDDDVDDDDADDDDADDDDVDDDDVDDDEEDDDDDFDDYDDEDDDEEDEDDDADIDDDGWEEVDDEDEEDDDDGEDWESELDDDDDDDDDDDEDEEDDEEDDDEGEEGDDSLAVDVDEDDDGEFDDDEDDDWT